MITFSELCKKVRYDINNDPMSYYTPDICEFTRKECLYVYKKYLNFNHNLRTSIENMAIMPTFLSPIFPSKRVPFAGVVLYPESIYRNYETLKDLTIKVDLLFINFYRFIGYNHNIFRYVILHELVHLETRKKDDNKIFRQRLLELGGILRVPKKEDVYKLIIL